MSGEAKDLTTENAEDAEQRRTLNGIGEKLIGASLRVHTALGPGLLESAYEACLVHELTKVRLAAQRQLVLPILYDGVALDAGYRLDLLIEGQVVVELKAVEQLTNVHTAQVLSYLKLGGFRLGYLLNFNVARMKDGIRRVVNDL